MLLRFRCTKGLSSSSRSSTFTMPSIHSPCQCSFQRASRCSIMSITNTTPTFPTPPSKIPTPFAALRFHKRWPRLQTLHFIFQPPWWNRPIQDFLLFFYSASKFEKQSVLYYLFCMGFYPLVLLLCKARQEYAFLFSPTAYKAQNKASCRLFSFALPITTLEILIRKAMMRNVIGCHSRNCCLNNFLTGGRRFNWLLDWVADF